jgi:hypothetical protein
MPYQLPQGSWEIFKDDIYVCTVGCLELCLVSDIMDCLRKIVLRRMEHDKSVNEEKRIVSSA